MYFVLEKSKFKLDLILTYFDLYLDSCVEKINAKYIIDFKT